MRHRKTGHKLGRTEAHRRATLRNLAAGLFEHGQITTTLPKARAVQPFAEKLITLAKRGDLHSRRIVLSRLRDRVMADNEDKVERNRYGELRKGPKLVKHLFEEIAPRFADRPGGYTRIVKLGQKRIGDKADLCVLQLVGDEDGPEIGGRVSTRRRTADGRTAYAKQVLKASAPAVTEEPEAAAPVEAEAAVETDVVEEATPTEEATAEETPEKKPADGE